MNRIVLIEQLKAIINPIVRQYASFGFYGNHESCHGIGISWFELFCRSSYGIIPYTYATGDCCYLPFFSETLLKIVKDPLYSTFKDYDQKAVELVPVATLLLMFRDNTWDHYTTEQKDDIETYFCRINEIELCNNNWLFFRILVCAILQELTNKDFSRQIENDWETIDGFYQGDGWYRDGREGPKDYYNAFGFHFYSLLYSFLFQDSNRNIIIKERALLFAKQFAFFFDIEGRCIPYGRSLIYRYATASFWSMMLVNDLLSGDDEIEAIEIVSKNYGWWSKQNIYDDHGFQNLGYTYPNDYMLEAYNSSGSVYWSLKFFLILLADDKSLVWKYNPHAKRTRDGIYTIANGDIIIQTGRLGNTAYINSYKGSGQSQDFAKYMHFAYNSVTGFNISKSENCFDLLSDDSSLVFNVNGIKKKRTENFFYSCRDNIQEYVWTIDKSIDIVSTVVPLIDYYLRIHVIRSNIACECFETGFPIKNTFDKSDSIANNEAIARSDNLVSFMGMIRGQGIPIVINNEVDSNIYYRDTIMPALRYVISKGVSVIADYTGIISEGVASQDITNRISGIIEFNDNVAIINNADKIVKIPLYITRSISRQLFLYKIKRCIRSFEAYLKRTIKGLILH